MIYKTRVGADTFVVSFREQPKLVDGLNFLWVFALFGYGYISRDSTLIAALATLSGLGLIFFSLRRMYGSSSLVIDQDSVTVTRSVFNVGRKTRFPRADVERLGYEPEVSSGEIHEDAALALMVRTRVMPIRFAQTITPADAEAVLAALEKSGSWVSAHVRAVGTPLF